MRPEPIPHPPTFVCLFKLWSLCTGVIWSKWPSKVEEEGKGEGEGVLPMSNTWRGKGFVRARACVRACVCHWQGPPPAYLGLAPALVKVNQSEKCWQVHFPFCHFKVSLSHFQSLQELSPPPLCTTPLWPKACPSKDLYYNLCKSDARHHLMRLKAS